MSPRNYQLPQNVTIREIVGALHDPVEYVRQVFGNMMKVKHARHECIQQHDEPVVRIGVTGQGAYPHYRVDPSADQLEVLEAYEEYDEGKENDYREYYFRAFHGRSHKELTWGIMELRGDSWSTGHMTLKEIRELLGELRGLKRR